MIAANFRKYPEALANQLCLAFTRTRWALARPGSRILRAIRAARAQLAARQAQVPAWMPPITIKPNAATPAWWSAAQHNARALARAHRRACMALFPDGCHMTGLRIEAYDLD